MESRAYRFDETTDLLYGVPGESIVTEINDLEPKRSWVFLGRRLRRAGLFALSTLLFLRVSLPPITALLFLPEVQFPPMVLYLLAGMGGGAMVLGLYLLSRAPMMCHYRLFHTEGRVVLQTAGGIGGDGRRLLLAGSYLLVGGLLWFYLAVPLFVFLVSLLTTFAFAEHLIPLLTTAFLALQASRIEVWMLGVGGALLIIGLFLSLAKPRLMEKDIHLSKVTSWELVEDRYLGQNGESGRPTVSSTLKLLAALTYFFFSFWMVGPLWDLFDTVGLVVGIVLVTAGLIAVLLLLRRSVEVVVDRRLIVRSANGAALTLPFIQKRQAGKLGYFLRNLVNRPSASQSLESTLEYASLTDFEDISGSSRGLVSIPTGRARNRASWNETIQTVLRPMSPFLGASALSLFYVLVTGTVSGSYLPLAFAFLPFYASVTAVVASLMIYEILQLRKTDTPETSLSALESPGPKMGRRAVYAIGVVLFLIFHAATTSFLYAEGNPTSDPGLANFTILLFFGLGALLFLLLLGAFNRIAQAFQFTALQLNVEIGADRDKYMKIRTAKEPLGQEPEFAETGRGTESSQRRELRRSRSPRMKFTNEIVCIFHQGIFSLSRETVGTYYRPWIILGLFSVIAAWVFYAVAAIVNLSPTGLPFVFSLLLFLGLGVAVRQFVRWREPDWMVGIDPTLLGHEKHSLYFRSEDRARAFSSMLFNSRLNAMTGGARGRVPQ